MKLMQVLIAIDQLGNTLLGGWADETMSSKAYRTNSRWQKVINAIFFDPDHCRHAYMSEIDRQQLPPAFRESQPK